VRYARQNIFPTPCSSITANVFHGLDWGFRVADVVIAGLTTVKRGCGSIAPAEDEQAVDDGAIEGINA